MSKYSEQIVEAEPSPRFEKPKRPEQYPVMPLGVELSDKQREDLRHMNKGLELVTRKYEAFYDREEQERQQILTARRKLRDH